MKTRWKLDEELQLTDALKRTNKMEREENIREKQKLYIQLDDMEKSLQREKDLTGNLIKENMMLRNKIEFLKNESNHISDGNTGAGDDAWLFQASQSYDDQAKYEIEDDKITLHKEVQTEESNMSWSRQRSSSLERRVSPYRNETRRQRQMQIEMSQTQRIIDQPAAPGADLHFAPGGESTPFPGDASKFLSAPCFYQCKALLPRAQPCEKIFCNRYDFQVHCRSVHRISGFKFCKVLDTDSHNNL